jgi:hypothetical protein
MMGEYDGHILENEEKLGDEQDTRCEHKAGESCPVVFACPRF